MSAIPDTVVYALAFSYSLPVAWWVGICVAACLVILMAVRGRLGQYTNPGVTLSLFAILSVCSQISTRLSERRRVQSMFGQNTIPMAEGRVRSFVPGGIGGHPWESFAVSGTWFSYSDFFRDGGFNRTAAFGGPMRQGLQVRIYYLPSHGRNKIVRLEIAN